LNWQNVRFWPEADTADQSGYSFDLIESCFASVIQQVRHVSALAVRTLKPDSQDQRVSGILVLGGIHPDTAMGATVGDFLDKPINNGGLALSRPIASAVIGAFIIGCLLLLPQRAARHPGQSELAS
jgi:hypothetical protein